jgi:CRP/FNR family transcriptional regulator
MLYKRGEVIKKEGETIQSFLYLRKGLVKLYKTDRLGKDHILSINKPGDFVNLLSIFSEQNYQYSIAALEDTLVCDVELETIKHVVSTNGKFSLRILNKMSQISHEIIENRFVQSQKQVKGRIAQILLYFSEKVYHNDRFQLPLTRREVGELLSITTENTIRTLSEFKKDGLIEIDGKVIHIPDKKRLESINISG